MGPRAQRPGLPLERKGPSFSQSGGQMGEWGESRQQCGLWKAGTVPGPAPASCARQDPGWGKGGGKKSVLGYKVSVGYGTGRGAAMGLLRQLELNSEARRKSPMRLSARGCEPTLAWGRSCTACPGGGGHGHTLCRLCLGGFSPSAQDVQGVQVGPTQLRST